MKLAAVLAWRCRWALAPTRIRSRHGRECERGEPGSHRISWSMVATACSLRAIRPISAAGKCDPRQAGAVVADLQPLFVYHRRPCRRTWYPRIHIALGARRAQSVRAYLASRGHRPEPDCAPSPTARSARSRSATTSRAGSAETAARHRAQREFLRNVAPRFDRRLRAPVLFWRRVGRVGRRPSNRSKPHEIGKRGRDILILMNGAARNWPLACFHRPALNHSARSSAGIEMPVTIPAYSLSQCGRLSRSRRSRRQGKNVIQAPTPSTAAAIAALLAMSQPASSLAFAHSGRLRDADRAFGETSCAN